MRFSILTLDLGQLSNADLRAAVVPLSRFIAENNISCVCLQSCDDPEENAAGQVVTQLGQFGLKHDLVREGAPSSGNHPPCASAVITQLPIIGSASHLKTSPAKPATPDSPQIVAARLGVSPDVIIDVYNVRVAGARSPAGQQGSDLLSRRLLDFVDDSVPLFASDPEPVPRRRGRPPRVSQSAKRNEPVRMVFLAGMLPEPTDPRANGPIQQAGYFDASRDARTASGDGPANPNDAPAHAICVRPGLRPTDAERVYPVAPPPEGHSGLLLGFEI